jgi:hypothetical protein
MARRLTTRPDDLPIPVDAKAHSSWPPIMLEIAAHIGAYDTLRIVDAYAGQRVYIPIDASRNPLRDLIGSDKAAIMSQVFGIETLLIPSGRRPLERARRAGVVALVRAKKMTVSDAAALLRMAPRHLTTLINKTDEGTDDEPLVMLERPRDARQLEMFEPDPTT